MHQKHVKFEAYDCIVKLSYERFWFACMKLTHPSLLPYLQASWTVVLFKKNLMHQTIFQIRAVDAS